ncbi:MAG: DUF1801 domain-containing protein [Bacteroidota bacterium]
MNLIQDPKVEQLFDNYPKAISKRLKILRQYIIDTAEAEEVDQLKEVVKWGEPSYLARQGSTIRLGSVRNNPNQYAMYFICTTSLVTTFRMIYGEDLQFDGNRAILFNIDDQIPLNPLKHCIALALKYHKIKDLPMLGV